MNEKIEKLLKDRGVNPTAMRNLVLKYLLSNPLAVSLNDLEVAFDRADKSTLFRTLKTFEEHKLIHRIDDGSGVAKYALCFQSCECSLPDIHYHFTCEKCQSTFCLPNISLLPLQLPPFFTLHQANLVLKGICANCHN